ncbi:carbon-nitrogen hydrolase family protein [Rhizobium sp. NPDC090275]|uniref:carbon-nitrogen hydrolase family protein n=1 Tax=Rhizobium sp. NPDC090275 TaxID=3364498 RepID=UPI00383B239C
MKIALIQMSSQPDLGHNLAEVERMMTEALAGNPNLIVLPEHFDWMGGSSDDKRAAADFVPGGQAYNCVQDFARRHRVAVHAGSLMERCTRSGKVFNTTVIFDCDGGHVGAYRKIHLFDITTPNGVRYAESSVVAAGDGLLVYDLNGWKVGCAICYDLRFSRLFDRLAQEVVDIFILPAAFTRQTGEAHWEVLCRARAIEYQAFFVACGQCGSYPALSGNPRETFGSSLVADPWGEIIANAGQKPCVLHVTLDRKRLDEVKGLIPMRSHRVDMNRVQMQVHPSGR